MTELETKVAEARVEASIETYLAHADDYKNGFTQGVLTIFDMCYEQLHIPNTFFIDFFTIHQNPRVSSILIDFLKEKETRQP